MLVVYMYMYNATLMNYYIYIPVGGVAEVDVEVIDKLTYGLLAQFLPKLQRSQATLTEVK